MVKIVIVSNGYGEDLIASKLVTALLKQGTPKESIYAAPLIGHGNIYQSLGASIMTTEDPLPSGGFLRSILAFIRDIKHGLLGRLSRQLTAMKPLKENATYTIAVGDVFCLFMAAQHNHSPLYFLPTAKSDLFMKHSFLEKLYIRKKAALVFPRDEVTTANFNKSAIHADFFGNPMFENLLPETTLPVVQTQKTITWLPGSREEAFKNLSYFLTLIDNLPDTIQHILTIPPTLPLNKILLHNEKWTALYQNKTQYLLSKSKKVLLTQAFVSAVQESDIVVGLAGTANEQAVFLGKTVLTFPGFGPQSTLKRFKEQHKLLGKNLIVLPKRHRQQLLKTIIKQLQDSPASKKTTPLLTNVSAKIVNTIQNDAQLHTSSEAS